MDLVGVGHVGHLSDRPLPLRARGVDLGDGGIESGGLDVGQHHVHAGGGEAQGERLAHAAGGSGDDGGLACE